MVRNYIFFGKIKCKNIIFPPSAMHSTCVVQPIQRNVINDDADFNALMQTNERAIRFKNTCYTNPYAHRMIRQLLPVYDQRGLLDKNQ